jgi:hypothetical protein
MRLVSALAFSPFWRHCGNNDDIHLTDVHWIADKDNFNQLKINTFSFSQQP